jgi:hypothetical protein
MTDPLQHPDDAVHEALVGAEGGDDPTEAIEAELRESQEAQENAVDWFGYEPDGDDRPEWEREVPPAVDEGTPAQDEQWALEDRVIKRANELEGPGVSHLEAVQMARVELASEEAERERKAREARNQAAQKADAPTDAKAWNGRLSESAADSKERWGLKDLDTGQSVRPEGNDSVGKIKEPQYMRKRPGAKDFRLAEEIEGLSQGGGADSPSDEGWEAAEVLIDEQPPTGEGSGNREATGRKKAPANAVRVTLPDGTPDLSGIGNDTEAIQGWLGDQDYAPAIARRRSADAKQLRAELAIKVAELLERDATQSAIAENLGCTVKTVRTLRDEAQIAA